ncbi:peptide deformylase [Shimia abyssi]|uniref:Peptide deformylase n=1 Tax=Shimia abyssi TaxID=1662395 RepID=A0A2P8F7Z5_9RHOB|nr:peptide deformylase [Shimia abyssi]PSL17843.1 peptide deformylase [Shimia abyssi]
MSVLPLVFWPDPRLSQPCAPVGEADHEALVADMFDTLYAAKGRGLAAPQVGVLRRIFVMDVGWKSGDPTPEAFLDPVITVREQRVDVLEEGCLSIPGLMVPVERPVAITLAWRDARGDMHMRDFDGFEARCIQHEIDHLDGRITLDHLSSQDKAALLAEYKGPQ